MNRNREMMLKELMELDLRLYDLLLYLDTHPFEHKAVDEYNKSANKCKAMTQHFEKLYGPLTISDKDNNTTPWEWIKSPWPWQNCDELEPIEEKEVEKHVGV